MGQQSEGRRRPGPPTRAGSQREATVTVHVDFDGAALDALNWFHRRHPKRNQAQLVRGAVVALYAIRSGEERAGRAAGRSMFAVGFWCLVIGFAAGVLGKIYVF